MLKSFASDNASGAHPKIIEAMIAANVGHATAYGYDEYTKRADKKFKEHFGDDAEAYFLFNGTAANVVGLAGVTSSYSSVICSEVAHINTDECAAPQKFIGCRLLTVPTEDGKITIDGIKKHVIRIGDHHYAQPRVISLTQSTEYGTVYTPSEIKKIADYAHEQGMYLHIDGARLANAAVSLGLSLREISTDVGVDVLSFGGTKNGLMFGDAVVFFKSHYFKDFKYIRKQAMQLASKMRFISCQFEALLTDNLWLQNAKHANDMAKLLAKELEKIPELKITQKVEANAVFVLMPLNLIPLLQEKYYFYIWDEAKSEVRLMTAFDTTEEDIKGFVSTVKDIVGKSTVSL